MLNFRALWLFMSVTISYIYTQFYSPPWY